MAEYRVNHKGQILAKKYSHGYSRWASPTAKDRRAIRKALCKQGVKVQPEQWEVETTTDDTHVHVSVVREDESMYIGCVPNTVDAPLTPAQRRTIARENGTVLAKAFRDRVIYGRDLAKPNFELRAPQIPNPIFSDELAALRAVAEDRAADLNALLG